MIEVTIKNLAHKINYPTLILMLGSVFIIYQNNIEVLETIRIYWTLLCGMVFLTLYTIQKFLYPKWRLSVSSILRSIFIIGCLEIVYLVLQALKILPSYNPYYGLSGSFINPSMYGMLFSFCIPIGLFFSIRHKQIIKRIVWMLTVLCMIISITKYIDRTSIISTTLASLILVYNEVPILKKKIKMLISIFVIFIITITVISFVYYIKKESADGRILIWNVTLDMFTSHPLWGLGSNGFSANYMNHQALFFEKNPHSKYMMLADNVKQPFNTFLLVLVDWGIFGFVLLLSIIILTISVLVKSTIKERYALVSIIVALIVCCCFSYPQNIPFVWSVVFVVFIVLFDNVKNNKQMDWIYIIILIVLSFLLPKICYTLYNKQKWMRAQQLYYVGSVPSALAQYEKIYIYFSKNKNFLYNYGAVLHHTKHYRESLNILYQCKTKVDDYDIRMLIADNYHHLTESDSALQHFRDASYMIPNRFLPLYYMMNIYNEKGCFKQADSIAVQIINKPIKIPSEAINRIKNEAVSLHSVIHSP